MKRKIAKITGLSLLFIVTIANGGYLGYSLLHSTKPALSAVPSATLGVRSAKQHDIGVSKQGQKAETGDYKLLSLGKSKIESATPGRLVLAAQKELAANFILATDSAVAADETKINPDWTTTVVADDPLWAPGACSSKPTLLLQGKYIFIDDGKTKPTDTYNSYVVYNIAKSKYYYFGGDNYTDVQAKREKILVATNENDQLVFYIDQLDDKGSLTNTTSFKHATGSDHGYIIRRVIDPETMHYTDYHLTYNAPKGNPFFYLNAFNKRESGLLTVQLTTDDGYAGLEGTVKDNNITFQPAPNEPTASTQQTGPYDTDLEKDLEKPLSTLIPEYANKALYDPQVYATHFSIFKLASHKNILFLDVSDRQRTFTTPAVYDKETKKTSVLTTQKLESLNNYVSLGVF